MELIKNIFFNTDKLVEKSTVKISYTGYLFQDNSEKVFIHYGFGDSWENIQDVEMEKTELGFQYEIKLVNSGSLNLVFRNENDNWDNNFGQNFSFDIEPANENIEENEIESKELVVVEPQEISYPRKLRKSYLLMKKVKLAMYKFARILTLEIGTSKQTDEN